MIVERENIRLHMFIYMLIHVNWNGYMDPVVRIFPIFTPFTFQLAVDVFGRHLKIFYCFSTRRKSSQIGRKGTKLYSRKHI